MSDRGDGNRWLWITPEVRDDLSTGALVYSLQLARAVARTGTHVTIVGIGGDVETHEGITAITVDEELRGGVRSLLSPLPNLAYSCSPHAVRERVTQLLGQRWDAVVIDGLQAGWCSGLVASRHVGPTVFIAHNHEGSLRWNVAQETPWTSPRRLVLMIDAWKAARLERSAVRTADLVTSITTSDRDRFARDGGSATHVVITPGWSAGATVADAADAADAADDGRRTAIARRPRRIAILGSFGWHVKQENLRRFVAAADSVLADNDIELVVGGRIPDDVRATISAGTRATRFVGWIDDARTFLDSSRLGVVSEPLGGGFKLKTLDYVFNRLPLATTVGGASGLDLVAGASMIEADDEKALVAAIVEIIDDADRLERIASAAYDRCATSFTWDGRGRLLVDAVAALLCDASGRGQPST